jgi:predicted sulfurtransferase
MDNTYNSLSGPVAGKASDEAGSSASERAEKPDVVLLYYLYTDLPNPAEICQQQRELCAELFLYGRIRVTPEGLNGTLDGTHAHIAAYMQRMNESFAPHVIDWKLATYPDTCDKRFTSVRVGVKEEVVALHLDAEARQKMLLAGPGE